MHVDELLSKLQKVKRTGAGRWIACCPAHNDKSPSLSVRLADDDRILIHCFAGCELASVLGAVALNFSDIMPTSLLGHKRSERAPFTATDALRCISFEAKIVALCAIKILQGKKLSIKDKERLIKANERINGALDGVGL